VRFHTVVHAAIIPNPNNQNINSVQNNSHAPRSYQKRQYH
jgi:hypothetical protein